MNDDEILREFAELQKSFQGLHLKQEENCVDLLSYNKIVTSLSEVISSDINSPQHPFQFLDTFNKFSHNKKQIFKNISSMREYFFLNYKTLMNHLKRLKNDLIAYLRKFEVLRMQSHKCRERQEMHEEEKRSYLRSMKKVLSLTEHFSNHNLEFEKAIIDLKNQMNTFSVKEHDLYVKMALIDCKIQQIQQNFPEKSKQLPRLYQEYEAQSLEGKTRMLLAGKCRKKLSLRINFLKSKIDSLYQKANFLEKIFYLTNGQNYLFVNNKEISKDIALFTSLVIKVKQQIYKGIPFINSLKEKFGKAINEMELSKRVVREKSGKFFKTELDKLEDIQTTFNLIEYSKKQKEEETIVLEKNIEKLKEKEKENILLNQKLESLLIEELDKENNKKILKKIFNILRNNLTEMKEEKLRQKAEDKNKLKTLDTRMMQNKKVVNNPDNTGYKEQTENNKNVTICNELMETTNNQGVNETNQSNFKQKNNDILFNYQSNLKTKSSYALNSSLFEDAPKKTGKKKVFGNDLIEDEGMDFKDFNIFDGIAKGIQDVMKQGRAKKEKKKHAYENYLYK